MKKLAIILIATAWLFIVFMLVGWLWPNAKYKAWAVFRTDISVAYRGDDGNIYKIGVRHEAMDSVVEYYRNGINIWKGHIEPNGRSAAEFKKYVLEYFENRSSASYLTLANNDSIYCLFLLPDSSSNVSAEFINFNTLDEIHFESEKLATNETIKTGIILLYGHPVDYHSIKKATFDL